MVNCSVPVTTNVAVAGRPLRPERIRVDCDNPIPVIWKLTFTVAVDPPPENWMVPEYLPGVTLFGLAVTVSVNGWFGRTVPLLGFTETPGKFRIVVVKFVSAPVLVSVRMDDCVAGADVLVE